MWLCSLVCLVVSSERAKDDRAPLQRAATAWVSPIPCHPAWLPNAGRPLLPSELSLVSSSSFSTWCHVTSDCSADPVSGLDKLVRLAELVIDQTDQLADSYRGLEAGERIRHSDARQGASLVFSIDLIRIAYRLDSSSQLEPALASSYRACRMDASRPSLPSLACLDIRSAWSAPSAIGTGGLGFGGQAGAELTEFIIVLNSKVRWPLSNLPHRPCRTVHSPLFAPS